MVIKKKIWLYLSVGILLSFNTLLSVSEDCLSLRRSRELIACQFIQSMPASDRFYFQGLLSQYESDNDGAGQIVLKIGDNFIPSAMLTVEQRAKLMGVVDYAVLQDRYKGVSCGDVALWLLPMDGGIGSSLQREDYLKKIAGRDELGAKSTDVFLPIEINGQEAMVSVAEMKLLGAVKWAEEGKIGKVDYFELVSTESKKSINELMDTVYLLDRMDDSISQDNKRTYREVFEELGMDFEIAVQQLYPTIDTSTGTLSMERRAPGGHGYWGSWILQNILNWNGQGSAVAAIYNNDGPNNNPDQAMIRWMVDENIPIAMVTTTRTSLDAKGGIIGVVTLPDGSTYTDLMELAQAKSVGQVDQFQAMGLTEGEQGAQYFNTNMFLFNVGLLSPFLKELKNTIGDDEFNRVVSPTLIQNTKSQDGKQFIQLEGAIGSVVLNFSKYLATTDNQEVRALMKKYGIDRLVSILNVGEESRTDFFTPVKAAVDVWLLQPERGIFSVDNDGFSLVRNDSTKPLPSVTLADPAYKDLAVVLSDLSEVNLSNAASFTLEGRVKMPVVKIIGQVEIRSNFNGVFDLSKVHLSFGADSSQDKGMSILKNVRVFIDEVGTVTVEPIR